MRTNQREDENMPKGKSTGPRQQRPVFAVVRYTDESGAEQKLNSSGLNIQIERDSAKIVEFLTGGGDFGNAAVVRVEMPQPQTRAKSEAAPA
jgi:hypothetical protein